MRMTRTGTYILTTISALLFLFLTWAFADGLFSLDGDVLFSRTEGEDTAIADGSIWTYVLLALIIIAGLYQARRLPADGVELRPSQDMDTPGQVQDPAWWRLLLGNAHLALFWMPIRFYVGRAWLAAGEHKVRSDEWMSGGSALVSGNPEQPGFWERIVLMPPDVPRPAITYDWFRQLIQFMIDQGWASWFAKLVTVGEMLVGLGLLVGALVGIAAFFGTLLNFNFLLAGTTSTNPVLFGLGVFLVLAWKVAGWWGLDRWLLPMLGTPWYRGRLLSGGASHVETGTVTRGQPSA
jgi:thiosulfate dehydrogenase [quinone] large subunit